MIRRILVVQFMLASCFLGAGCSGDSDDDSGDGDGDTAGDGDGDDGVSEFCETYCTVGPQDVIDAGCENDTLYAYDDCMPNCEASLASPCGTEFETFWQCTLDKYPGNYECGDNGMASQPDSCADEQGAVSTCADSL